MSTADGAGSASALGDPAFFAGDPDTALADQRRERPVRWHDDGEFWAVCRHRDIQTVGKDPGTFCSGAGVLMADRGREIAAQDSILYLDPPRHGPYRKLVSRAFTPAGWPTSNRASASSPWSCSTPSTPVDRWIWSMP